MATQFVIPVAVSNKDKVIASPPPSQKGIMMASGKHIFWASVPSTNIRPADGIIIAFRNHVFRTDNEDIAEYIKTEFIDRKSPNLVVDSISEKELHSRMQRKATEAAPQSPMEGKIESLPNQDKAEIPPPVTSDSNPSSQTAILSTGMQNSVSVNPTLNKKP